MSESVSEITARLEKNFNFEITSERLAELQTKRIREEQSRKNLKIGELRAYWNAPIRHVRCTPDRNNAWGETVAKLIPKLGNGCLLGLIGTRGNGKTQMAVELMSAVTQELRTAYFTSAVGFFMAVKTTYKKDAVVSEEAVLREHVKPSLLVIDEIGKRAENDWENNLLFELVNRRYNALKDTLLIDNRSKAEFIETIGPSLASRMNDGGGIIECNWETFRK